MPDHIKPTQEELDANIAESLAEAERLKKEESQELPDPSKPPEEPPENTPDTEEPKEPVKPSTEEETPEDKQLKERYNQSTREAQVLYAKNKKLQEAIDQAGQITEPTDEEVRVAMKIDSTQWQEMPDFQKQLAKDNIWNKRKFDAINSAAQDGKDIDKWLIKVDEYISDPKTLLANPELEGKQEAFKSFASKPTRRGVDFDDLVLAFNGDVAKHKPAPKKGQMFETGSSGPNDAGKPKDDKLSITQARALMKTNYKKYKEYLLAGKIANE